MIGGEEHGRFRELVDRHQDIVVTTHMNPDGDALGSQLVVAPSSSLSGRGRFARARASALACQSAAPPPALATNDSEASPPPRKQASLQTSQLASTPNSSRASAARSAGAVTRNSRASSSWYA